MPLELATNIKTLNPSWPLGSDPIGQGDNHLRLIKSSLHGFFDRNYRLLLERDIKAIGFNLVAGSFQSGGVLVNPEDVLLDEDTGRFYTGPAGTVDPLTPPTTAGFVDRSDVLTSTVLSTIIHVDPYITLATRVIDGFNAARDAINSLGGGVGLLSAKQYVIEDEYIPADKVIFRGQGIGPSFAGATTIKWGGGDGTRKAVIRSSKYAIGIEGNNALSGVGVQNCVIDAEGCDIGFYSYYTTNNSNFDNLVTRNATVANTYIIKSWFTYYGNQQARDGKNQGIVIGKALFSEAGDIAVNACGFGWMQCKENGTAVTSYDPNSLSDDGAGLVLGRFANSNHFPSIQSEGNKGAGIHSATSFTNSFGSVYLESNSAASSGEKVAWVNISGGSFAALSTQTLHLATNQTLKNNVGRGMIFDVIHRGDNINTFTGTGEIVVLSGNLTSFSNTDWTKVAKTYTQLLAAIRVNVRYSSVVLDATRFYTAETLAYPQIVVVPRATVTLAAPLQIRIANNAAQNYGTVFTEGVPVVRRHSSVASGGYSLNVAGTLPTTDTFFDIFLIIPLLAGSGLQSPSI